MYPEANIPVVTISVNPFLSAAEQYKIGEALRGLGEENILVIGSGTTIHNFNYIKMGQQHPESLVNYEQLAPYASRAVPRAEHFVPLFHALGSSKGTATPRVLYRGYEMGSFSQICFEF